MEDERFIEDLDLINIRTKEKSLCSYINNNKPLPGRFFKTLILTGTKADRFLEQHHENNIYNLKDNFKDSAVWNVDIWIKVMRLTKTNHMEITENRKFENVLVTYLFIEEVNNLEVLESLHG